MLELVYDNLRMAIRSLTRRPFYTGVAIAILTLGLAASSTVITYINSFYRPFPGINADRLVQIKGSNETICTLPSRTRITSTTLPRPRAHSRASLPHKCPLPAV